MLQAYAGELQMTVIILHVLVSINGVDILQSQHYYINEPPYFDNKLTLRRKIRNLLKVAKFNYVGKMIICEKNEIILFFEQRLIL